MRSQSRIKSRVHACQRCSGDMFLEGGDYTCLQCGRSQPAPESQRRADLWAVLGNDIAQFRQSAPAEEKAA